MTFFLSDLHDDLRSVRLTRRGATHRPDDVPRGTHKEYPRMERIQLPEPGPIEMTLSDALNARNSAFTSGSEPLSIQDISMLFGHGLKQRPGSLHRNYPSGGGLYPIETYLVATALSGSIPGVFHYHPRSHALERLWDLPHSFNMTQLVPKPDFLLPTALVVFTSVWKRSSAKYGDFAYGLSLLEAGHMSENILLIAAALGLEVRPMAGFEDARTAELLDIDATSEQCVHTITLSKYSGPVIPLADSIDAAEY